MSAVSFIKTFFLSTIALLLSVGALNFFMDPAWTFSHSHRFNNVQGASNERIQKSNLLHFKKANYDALLLGSSRVTFFNQNDFKNNHVFNYAFSLGMPQEYAPYIDYAKKQNMQDIKKVYLGVDFFGSNKNFHNDVNPKEVFETIEGCCYRYRMLFSIDSLKTALFSFKAALTHNPGYRSYRRNNITMSAPRSEASVKKDVENKAIKAYMGDILHYAFNPEYVNPLKQLKEKNPDTQFIVFTTPTSDVYLKKLFELGHKEAYKQWLTALVDTFGSVYHFMDFNDVTTHYEHYYIDYHHLYPRYTSWIVDRLEGRDNPKIPQNFGILLNKENLQSYLDRI